MSAVDLSDAALSDNTHDTSRSSASYSTAQSQPDDGDNAPAITSASASRSSVQSEKRGRHSLGVLSALPTDISALIRSHSSPRQQPPSAVDTSLHEQMGVDDDRPTRKSTPGSRFYNFIARSLTRSQSRSRSRNGQRPSFDHDEPMPKLPEATHLPSSKPPTRIQSRPISSTTTATNTTITPGTPRARRRLVRETPRALEDCQTPTPSSSRASSARRKIQNLLGIPLSSPNKTSFTSSQTSSRRPSLDSGHEPGSDIGDNETTPKPLKSCPPHTRPQLKNSLQSPPRPAMRNASGSSANTSFTSASSRFQNFFKGQKTSSTAPRPDDVSGPRRRPSGTSYHRRNSSANSSQSPVVSSDSKVNAPVKGPPPSSVLRTPSTSPMTTPTILPPSPPRHTKMPVDGAVPQPNTDPGDNKDTNSGGAATSQGPHSRVALMQSRRQSHMSTKHGSFDFERPGWSAGSGITAAGVQRTGSTGTSHSGTTGTFGRHSLSSGIRDSAMGPGLAGVGTVQREASMKRAQERDEMIARVKDEERRKRKAAAHKSTGSDVSAATEKERGKGSAVGRNNSLQAPSRSGRSPEESNGRTTATTEKSSSWGRKRGGIIRGGGRQLTTIGLHHGPFAFEPAVPSSPTWSAASVSNGKVKDTSPTVSWAGENGRMVKDKEKERAKASEQLERGRGKEKERERDKDKATKEKKSSTGDRAPVPVPILTTVGHRSGLKGRSLDLGLELAWAPRTVREEALLPSSTFFSRSMSGSSLAGYSLKSAGSTPGGTETIEEKGERSGVGREVADVFRAALDSTDYATFKKYVHRFDAHDIPFDGPTGIVARVERLLTTAPNLNEDKRRKLLDDFVRVILQNM